MNSLVPAHPCTAVFEGLEKGQVPHYLPGENPFLAGAARTLRHPPTTRPTGGAETMYPEFMKQLRRQRRGRPASKRGNIGAERG